MPSRAPPRLLLGSCYKLMPPPAAEISRAAIALPADRCGCRLAGVFISSPTILSSVNDPSAPNPGTMCWYGVERACLLARCSRLCVCWYQVCPMGPRCAVHLAGNMCMQFCCCCRRHCTACSQFFGAKLSVYLPATLCCCLPAHIAALQHAPAVNVHI